MTARLSVNGHAPVSEKRLEYERQQLLLRQAYLAVPEILLTDLERLATKVPEPSCRAGALGMIIAIRRRRSWAQQESRPA